MSLGEKCDFKVGRIKAVKGGACLARYHKNKEAVEDDFIKKFGISHGSCQELSVDPKTGRIIIKFDDERQFTKFIEAVNKATMDVVMTVNIPKEGADTLVEFLEWKKQVGDWKSQLLARQVFELYQEWYRDNYHGHIDIHSTNEMGVELVKRNDHVYVIRNKQANKYELK